MYIYVQVDEGPPTKKQYRHEQNSSRDLQLFWRKVVALGPVVGSFHELLRRQIIATYPQKLHLLLCHSSCCARPGTLIIGIYMRKTGRRIGCP
jgi:hypothetical protein